MTRTVFFVSLLILSACGGREERGLPAALAPGTAAGFNVLIVTLDTTRADYLGCYGRSGVRRPSRWSSAA